MEKQYKIRAVTGCYGSERISFVKGLSCVWMLLKIVPLALVYGTSTVEKNSIQDCLMFSWASMYFGLSVFIDEFKRNCSFASCKIPLIISTKEGNSFDALFFIFRHYFPSPFLSPSSLPTLLLTDSSLVILPVNLLWP